MAARRIPLEQPPSAAEEQKVEQLQAAVRLQIGKRIKRLRREAGLTLRALEMRCNVSASYLSAVERGLSAPTSDLLVRLGYFLRVEPASFFSDRD